MRASNVLGVGAGVVLCATMVAVANPPKVDQPHEGRVSTSRPDQDAIMMKRYDMADEECRGGDHSPDDATCRGRDQLGNDLEKRGWCWAYSDERVIPVDYGWHRCDVPRPIGWSPGPDTKPEPITTTAVIPDETVTRAQFDRLQINMFREQVTKLMGTPGVNRSTQGGLGMDQLDTVTWGNPDGSQMILTFRNGLLASKTQFGLP